VQESEGGKEGWEEVLKKRRGTNASYIWPKVWPADEADADAIPDAPGGEAVTVPLNQKAYSNSQIQVIYRFYILAISDVMHSTQKFVWRRPVLQRPFDSPHHIYNQQGVA
jgi:hypothetical protein